MKKIIFLLTFIIISILLVSIIPSIIAAPELEKVKFVHYKKGEVKMPATAKKAAVCYKLFGVKWKSTPVNYVVNPSNTEGLSEGFVTTAIGNSAEEWDANTVKELFAQYSVNYSVSYGTFDGINAVSFDSNPQSGVIAETTIWYNSRTKEIVEFDIELDSDWQWGDAESNSSVMDVQNIATHEIGHAIGLADLYNNCVEETMYGYSGYGETSKRTLNAGDIAGLKRLYG